MMKFNQRDLQRAREIYVDAGATPDEMRDHPVHGFEVTSSAQQKLVDWLARNPDGPRQRAAINFGAMCVRTLHMRVVGGTETAQAPDPGR